MYCIFRRSSYGETLRSTNKDTVESTIHMSFKSTEYSAFICSICLSYNSADNTAICTTII
jgi:hypothetical protein